MRDGSPEPIVHELERRGLAAPALLLLEAHAPLRPLLAQAGTFLSPLLRPVLGRRAGAVDAALGDDAAYAELVEGLRRVVRR